MENESLTKRYNQLFKDGKLVQVHVAKWSMSCRLDKEDLGLSDKDEIPEFAKLGVKMLIDEAELRKFNKVEGQARNYLTSHSLNFPIAQAHFVPHKSIMRVVEKLNEFHDQYLDLVDGFINRYETLKRDQLAKYPSKRQALEPFYPTIENLRVKFSFDINMFEVAFPRKMKSITMAGVLAEEKAVERMTTKFEKEMEQQYARNVNDIDQFLKESVTGLRSKIVTTFESIADKIKRGDIITKTNLTTMKSIIDSFEGLNFMDDKAVQSRISEVAALVNNPSTDFKEDFAAVDQLQKAVTSLLDAANNVSDVDSVTGEYIRSISL